MATKRIIPDDDFGKIVIGTRINAKNISMRTKKDGLYVTVPPFTKTDRIMQVIDNYRQRLLVSFTKVSPKIITDGFSIDAPCFKLSVSVGGMRCFSVRREEEGVMRILCPKDVDFTLPQTQKLLNAAIVRAMKAGLADCGADENLINLVEDTSRSSAEELMTASGFIDLLIPRGGAGLIKSCVRNAKVPVIQTGTGVCHIYVDGSADFDMALKIIVNAKCSRPSVCNAAEVCLVDRCIAAKFLPRLYDALVTERSQNKVGLLLGDGASALIGGRSFTSPAGEGDFDREFLDYKLAVGVVDGVNGAVAHILAHSTGHSDCIVTSSPQSASLFTRLVDSAAVYVNASTRFTDGGEFGLGCEMGISTQKLHARGPMGLRELTTYKYIVTGSGNVR